jgi:hypothetical protein
VLIAAIVLFAAQASSATPAPSPTPTPVAATPVRTPSPVPAADPRRPRSLSDIARERRLGRLTGAGAVVVTTPEPEPDPAPSGTPSARRAGPVRVEDVQDNGAVTDGFVSVYGTVRNTGRVPACRVKIFLRLYDDHGVLLSTGETTTDLKIVAPGEAVTFGGIVRAPAGLRGSRERKADPLVDGPTSTNWQRVGRVDAEITDVSDVCR